MSTSEWLRRSIRDRRLVLGLGALAVGLLLTELDLTVFAAALPTMVGELGGLDQQLWIGTGYVVAGAVAMLVLGRLGDTLGRRTVFAGALAVFVLGSLVGALATSMTLVILARVIQGLGGGGLFVLVEAVVAELVPARRRVLVLSGVGVVFAVAAVAGPVLGGLLTQTIGWRWAFWIDVPLGAGAAFVAWRSLPVAKRARGVGHFDLVGSALLCLAVVGVVLLVVYGGQRPGGRFWTTLVAAASTAVAVVGLVIRERRGAQPVLPTALLAMPSFVIAVSTSAVLAVTMFGTVTYLPTCLQLVYGLSPTAAGVVMLSLVAGLGSATLISGQLISRTGRLDVFPLVGTVLVAAALMLIRGWTPDTGLLVVAGSLLVLGAGIGCAWEVLVVIVQQAAPAEDLGAATAVNGFVRELGVVAGTALVGRIFTAGLVSRLGPGATSGVLTPADVARLPTDQRAEVARAYSESFTSAVTGLVPVLGAAGVGLMIVFLCRHRSRPGWRR